MDVFRLLRGLAALAVILSAIGCSEKVVIDDGASSEVRVDLDRGTALSLEAAPADFRLTITNPRTRDTLGVRSLTLQRGYLVGTFGPFPALRTLRFTVEAADQATGVVMYRGAADATIIPYRRLVLDIDLRPVAPILKFTPRFVTVAADSSFALSMDLFNVPRLYGVSYRVVWSSVNGLTIDSVSPGDELADRVIFFAQPDQDTSYTFAITETDTTATLAGVDGNVSLGRMYFKLARQVEPWFDLTLQVTSASENDNGQIVDLPVDAILADECRVEEPPAVPIGSTF